MDRRFTEQEARQIFALAAEREQAAQTRPDAGLTLTDLEEAARAAGIDPAFVQAAAVDFLHSGEEPLRRTFAGVPVELRRTRLLPHTLDEDGWAETVAALRRIFGKHGTVTDLGRSREWVSEADEKSMPVRVLLEEEDGRLRVAIGRNRWPQVLGLSLATGINFTVGAVLFAIWLLSPPSPLWIPALVLVLFAVLFGGGSYTGLRLSERRDARRFAEAFAEIERIAERSATARPADAEHLGPERLDAEPRAPAPRPEIRLDEPEADPAADPPATARRTRS